LLSNPQYILFSKYVDFVYVESVENITRLSMNPRIVEVDLFKNELVKYYFSVVLCLFSFLLFHFQTVIFLFVILGWELLILHIT
jgi:hypothetical protein